MTRVTVTFPEGLDELFEQWARTTGLNIDLVRTDRGASDFEFNADKNAQAVLRTFAAYVIDIINGAEIRDRSD
jgi:hypothetical protein